MIRPPLRPVEKLLLVALGFQILFVAWQTASGQALLTWDAGAQLQTSRSSVVFDWHVGPTALWLIFLGVLIAAASWLTIVRSPGGHACGIALYLAQTLQVTRPDGSGWGFVFTPTITVDLGATLAINLAACVLLVMSLIALIDRRHANEIARRPAAPEELLRLR